MESELPGGAPTFGRYQLLQRIGRGGMAEVFKAKSFGVAGFEKQLCIKRIVPELLALPRFVEMFVQEAKLAVRLSHANIVQVFDLGRVEAPGGPPSYFIAMEWVPGVDLATVLSRRQKTRAPLPLGMAVFIAGEIGKALDHAHRRHDEQGRPLGIVHRDISPQNILLSWEGDVKVTDFGIAKATDTIAGDAPTSELGAERATGKISFMSPEQSRSERTDARSDLFSLGTLMYEMIAGANPFTAPTAGETMRRIGVSEHPPLDLARPDTPPELCAIVHQLLEADPTRRTPSAAELCEQLLAYAYTSGERYGPLDLAEELQPLRDPPEPAELEPGSVFAEPAVEKTPVEIPHTSAPPPPASQSEPGAGERREVTAMVLPLSDRSRTEGASPALLERVRELCERHGGWIEELAPSQVVAIFGLGDTDGRDADAAVRAALVLGRERKLGAVRSAGIHSGPISVDDGGIPLHDERMVSLLGVAQSLARAAGGQVVLSPTTARLVRRSFVTEPLPPNVRAMAEGASVVRGALQGELSSSRFVGRHAELKRLGGILAGATRSRPQLCVLRGETGLGKTRLLGEAKRRLARGHFNVAFYDASCPLNGAGEPWSGLRAMLRVLCGTQEDDDPHRVIEVRPRLRALGLGDDQAAAVLALLGARVRTQEIDLGSALRGAFGRMVQSLATDRLHCFCWDDAQALDGETLDAILRIMRRGPSLRAVFILTQRGEVPPALVKQKDVQTIELRPFSDAEVATLVEHQLGARSIPAALLDYVRACAGGHPLFVDELVRELCDTGAVQVLSGVVTLRAEAHASAPRTLRTLIADRVSRLHQRERRVLQGIAILDEPAFTPILSAVLEQALPTLDRHLSNLEQKGLVRRTGPTQVRFASPLYLEIVLDAMPASLRAELHATAAAVYEASDAAGPGDTAEHVALHLCGAGKHERAVDFFWQSAEDKLSAGQLEGAQRAMLRGLDLCDPATRDVGELFGWLDRLSEVVSRTRHAPGLKDAIGAVLREVVERGDQPLRVRGQVAAARALGAVNLFDDAYDALDKALDGLDDVPSRRVALGAEIELAGRQGLFVRARRACDELAQLGSVDDPRTLMAMALARASSGETDLALRIIDQADASSRPRDAAEAVLRGKHRVLVHFNARDFAAAAREASKVAQLALPAGLRYEAAAALHNLGDSSDRVGDHPRAYAAFVESLELAQQIDHDRLTNLNQMHLCLLDGLRNAGGARARLEAHIRHADARGYLWDVLEGRFLLARLATAHGDHDEAKKQLYDVIAIAEEQGHALLGLDAQDLLARIQGS